MPPVSRSGRGNRGFGLATKVVYDRERKTLCRSRNYIGTEQERTVSRWTWDPLGASICTSLAGKPPFGTSCLKQTNLWLKKSEQSVLKQINPTAASLTQKTLQVNPTACLPTDHSLAASDEVPNSGCISPVTHHQPHHCAQVFGCCQHFGP